MSSGVSKLAAAGLAKGSDGNMAKLQKSKRFAQAAQAGWANSSAGRRGIIAVLIVCFEHRYVHCPDAGRRRLD
jgi:hypothetical protein